MMMSGKAFGLAGGGAATPADESAPESTSAAATTGSAAVAFGSAGPNNVRCGCSALKRVPVMPRTRDSRSEEHTSELQSQSNLVCRLLLEKKKKKIKYNLVNTY